jgi:hypothetical protein
MARATSLSLSVVSGRGVIRLRQREEEAGARLSGSCGGPLKRIIEEREQSDPSIEPVLRRSGRTRICVSV